MTTASESRPDQSLKLAPLRRPGSLLQPDPLIPTVFHNRWWLEAASGGSHQEAEVRSGGRVIARLPYVIERNVAGQRMCTMPELSHFLGPAIDLEVGNRANRSLKHFRITRELLAQLPPCSAFYHKMHRGVDNTLAFEEEGCTSMVQFTYEIAPSSDRVMWRAMRDKTRNVIRRAGERCQVVRSDDPCEFSVFYEKNLARRGLNNLLRHMPAVCTAAMDHGQGYILQAQAESGATLGAIFVVWDEQVAYYLLATRGPGADNGVISLLVWRAIRDAAASGLTFDFDGLGTPGSRLFYTGFGGNIAPRLVVTRYSLGHRLVSRVSGLLNLRHTQSRAAIARAGGAAR